MLKDLGVSALKDFIGFLKKEKDFFSLDEKNRHVTLLKVFKKDEYPFVFMDYLAKVSEKHFLNEIHEALSVFDTSKYANPKNEFLNHLALYISGEFAQKFDHLNISFFFEPLPERMKILEKLFPGPSSLHQTLRDLVLRSTYQEIGMMANASLSLLKEVPILVVQTPIELDSELRLQIRANILQKYPFSFPEFQITPQIIGGIRLFAGGKVIDHSWMGKIQSLANLSAMSK